MLKRRRFAHVARHRQLDLEAVERGQRAEREQRPGRPRPQVPVVAVEPVEPQVADEHAVLFVRGPEEADARGPADIAAGAIAPDEPGCFGGLVPGPGAQLCPHPWPFVRQAGQLRAVLDVPAQLLQPLAQRLLHKRLRDQHCAGVGTARVVDDIGVEIMDTARYRPFPRQQWDAGTAGSEDPPAKPEVVQELDAARLQALATRTGARPWQTVDDPHSEVTPQQVDTQHEAGRSRSHDQHVVRHHPSPIRSSKGSVALADRCA